MGPLARGGKSRAHGAASEHDVAPAATVTPVGLFLPTRDERFLDGGPSTVTRDCLGACLTPWRESVRERFPHRTTRVLTLDHGPENHRRRTPCMPRMVDFVPQSHRHVRRGYAPPSPSTSPPVERGWGILEHHGKGALLDSLAAVRGFARPMTWQGLQPGVALVTTTSHPGVTLTQEAMDHVEAQRKRLAHVEKWFVDIVCPDYPPPAAWDT